MRDEFPKPVAEMLAKRVGYRCSNPSCRKLTSGPHTDDAKAVNVGVAGHITAASPGGPRYDPSLTGEQRRSADNGIWLCQTCGQLLDNDEERFPVILHLGAAGNVHTTTVRAFTAAEMDKIIAKVHVG